MQNSVRLYRWMGILNLVILAVNIYVPVLFVKGGLSLLRSERWVTGPLAENFTLAFGPYAFLGIGLGMALLGLSGFFLIFKRAAGGILSIVGTALLCLPSWVLALVAYLLGSQDIGPEAYKFAIPLPFLAYDTSATMFFTLYLLIQTLIYYTVRKSAKVQK